MEASSSSEDWSLMCPNRSRSQMSLRNVYINIFKHLKNYTARKAEIILNHTLVKSIKLYSNMYPKEQDWATLENSVKLKNKSQEIFFQIINQEKL